MNGKRKAQALVYCQGAFGTTNGKTAHGLVRRSERWQVAAVIDARHAGEDAGQVLDGKPNGIPVLASLDQAIGESGAQAADLSHFVIGLAPDGGRLEPEHRAAVVGALEQDMHVISGLHDFLGDDPELARLASERGVTITDVRRPLPRDALHFFSGEIKRVRSFRVAVLGTDSAVGKRTTAWLLVERLREQGLRAELIGTGQTAWMQGARFGLILDSVINDFVAGEIEHAILRAWDNEHPDVLVLEGQGSILHPAYPGGFELLAAGRPDAIVLQHAPTRLFYDGFPEWPLHPLDRQIAALQAISDKPVVAIAVNREGLDRDSLAAACAAVHDQTGLPSMEPLSDGGASLTAVVRQVMDRGTGK